MLSLLLLLRLLLLLLLRLLLLQVTSAGPTKPSQPWTRPLPTAVRPHGKADFLVLITPPFLAVLPWRLACGSLDEAAVGLKAQMLCA